MTLAKTGGLRCSLKAASYATTQIAPSTNTDIPCCTGFASGENIAITTRELPRSALIQRTTGRTRCRDVTHVETADKVRQAVDGLPPKQRESLILEYWNGSKFVDGCT